MKLSQRIMFAKAFATGLAFLSFAALAADKSVWNSPSGTEWSVGVWAKGTSENGYWFNNAEGASTVLNNDILVTFADAYSIPYNLKFENNNNGNGVVRFLADDDSKGLSVTGQLQLGWGNDRGSLWLERGSYYATDKLYFRGGELTINTGASLSVTNESSISVDGSNGRDATLNVNGGSFSVLNSNLNVGYQDDRTGSVVMTNGNVDVRYQIQVAKSNNSTGIFAISNGTVNCGTLFQVGLYGHGEFYMEDGTVNCGESFRMATDRAEATATGVMNGGLIKTTSTSKDEYGMMVGNNGTAEFTMNGGEISCAKRLHLGYVSTSSGTFTMNGGRITTGDEIYIGEGGTGVFTLNDGAIVGGDQFWLGGGASSDGTFVMNGGIVTNKSYTCVGYGSGVGHFIMNGGSYYQENEKFIVGQSNSDTAYGECIVSNGTINVPNLWVAENTKRGTLTMEGGEFISRGETQMSRNSGAGKGTIILNGGTLSVFRFVSSSGTGGEVIFNGGTLKALDNRGDFIPDIANCEFKIAAGGAVFDTNGKNVTVADTLGNAEGLVGNGTIAKKGLGTLTISSNLDLERTFKFTIDTDLGAAGVGTIALTGSNTLEAGDKITVEIDPVNAETNVAYTVMTGLGAVTMGDIVLTGTDFYSYTGEVTDGTLSVTLQYGPTAPITARYDNGAWGVYNADGNLIPEGSAADLTTYVFTGSEPAGDFENYATTHKVALVATGIGVTNTINISSNVNAHHLAVSTDEGCAVVLSGDFTLAADSLVNSGTLIFDGNVTLSGVVNYPFYIAEGARVTLVTPQTIGGEISGTGTFALTGGTFGYLKTGETTIMDAFAGTLVLCAGSQLDTQYNRRGNPDKFHIMLGTARVRMEGATLTVPNDNEAYIYNEVDIVSSTENVIQGWNNALCLNGRLIGGGTVTLRCPGNRGGRIQGDASDFTGTCIIENAFGANGGDEGFHGANAGSQNATWVLPADGICSEEYKKTYYVGAQDATIYFGAFQQTGAKTYVCIGTTGTSIQIGNLAGGESVIEGRFTNNPFTLSKVGADSWLTLGTNFNMVAGSTVNIAEGGLGFNLPEGETVTALTNATVSISPSATARVSMTAAQYAALDTAQTYTLAKLASSPGVSKLATVLSVDGEVPHDRNADKWRVCFKFVGATAQEDAHYEAVLGYFAPGFVIIVQ